MSAQIWSKYTTFQSHIPTDLASIALDSSKKTVGGALKPFDKIFWHTQYRILLNQPTCFYIQNNAMPQRSLSAFKRDLKSNGLGAVLLRNSLFKAALKDHAHSQTASFYKRDFMKLLQVPVGPTMMVFSNSNLDAVHQIKPLAAILKKLRASNHALLVGARVGNLVLTSESFLEAAALPLQSELHAELLGLLSHPASNLVSTLEANQTSLIMNLEQLQKQSQ